MLGNLKKTCCAAMLAALAGATTPAAAQTDREFDTPTGWWWMYGVNSTTVNDKIAEGFRVFDMDRVPGGTYDAVFVQNSGVYNNGNADWYTSMNGTTLGNTLNAQNQRLLDIEPYDGGTETRFTATAISNTGDDAAGWGWLYQATPASITNWVATNPTPIRLIDLDKYNFNGVDYYSAVAVNNTGSFAKGWTFHFAKTPAEVATILSDNNQRLVSLEVDSASPLRFTIITQTNDGTGWWWYYGLSAQQVGDYADLNGARIIDLERYVDGGGTTRFAAVMIDNSNALSAQVRQVAAAGLADSAQGGGYLKEVGGPVFASIGANYIFEPASMLKILYGTYAIDRCAAGTDNLLTDVFVGDTCNNNECPDGVNCNPGWEDLQVAIAEMLQQSDNNRTKVIHDRYTRATLNAYADAIGMSRTHINHDIGCGTPANQLTLADCGLLYERIADGSLFPQNWADTLYTLMNDSFGNQGSFNTEISNQAVGLNLTSSEIADFKALAYMATKGGSYGVADGNGNCCVNHRTTGGWMRLPWKTAGGVIYTEEYVIQSFVNNEPNASNASSTNSSIWWTMARNRIRAALQSWDSACTDMSITQQPNSIIVTAGDPASFGVSVSGIGSRTYQWRRNGVNLVNGPGPSGSSISGATAATMTISNAQDANEGTYTCVITSVCDSVTTFSRTLTVVPYCGSADFDGDGDSGTDADIEAFFACLGGNCCRSCESADFDGDGDTGTDADIEAFFRVLGGGTC